MTSYRISHNFLCRLLLLLFLTFACLYQHTSVWAADSAITLNKSTWVVSKSSKKKLKASINDKKYKKSPIIWSTSKKAVASVNKNGKVTAQKLGKTVIKAKIKGTKKAASCDLIVGYPVTKIIVKNSNMSIQTGDVTKIVSEFKPSNASIKKLAYQTSNSNIAKVDASGKITAVAVGKAKITIRSLDGNNVSKVIDVEVTKKIEAGSVGSTGEIQVNSPTSPSQKAKILVNKLTEFSEIIKLHGDLCTYSRSTTDNYFEEVQKLFDQGKKVRMNCATSTIWSLKEMGVIPPTGNLYGSTNGFSFNTNTTKSMVQSAAKILSAGEPIGLGVQTACDKGLLVKGDIVAVRIGSTSHTCVYYGKDSNGNSLFFDSGGLACAAGYANVGCGPINYSKHDNYIIKEIIRLK